MSVEHQIASHLAITKDAEEKIASDIRHALAQAFREGQLAVPSAINPYADMGAVPFFPGWADAPAVIAHTEGRQRRRVFVRAPDGYGEVDWDDEHGTWYTEDLIDPVPLTPPLGDAAYERGVQDGINLAIERLVGWER